MSSANTISSDKLIFLCSGQELQMIKCCIFFTNRYQKNKMDKEISIEPDPEKPFDNGKDMFALTDNKINNEKAILDSIHM